MDLVLRADTPAPAKPAWHNPDPKVRGEWSSIYESITTWFCSSHDFNKQDNLVIIVDDGMIRFNGTTLRYLGPSLRSAASLVRKAFVVLKELELEQVKESTPGIFAHGSTLSYEFPDPWSSLHLGPEQSNSFPTTGTIFAFPRSQAKDYYVPASRISQGLVWFLQARFS